MLPLKHRTTKADAAPPSDDIAIIGMACMFPQAGELQVFWENILRKVDAITEVPPHRFDWRLYFDRDGNAPDGIYAKVGGFLDEVPFDPLLYGMPPTSLASVEPAHLLTLEVVRAALRDAGYADASKPMPRETTSVILGTGGAIGELGQRYVLRSTLPMYVDGIAPDVLQRLPEWTEDSFPGILTNVLAGRVANQFDFGGVNYTLDAACASSLTAVYDGVRELQTGTSDVVIAGGVDVGQSPFTFTSFCKTHALSKSGRSRVFDRKADGIVISEGLAVLVLKRADDAERDGDRVYAVIKGVAGSSDGRGKSMTAPLREGQIRALRRAYDKAGFSPATLGLLEAHGTGTAVGDTTEATTVADFLRDGGAAPATCGLGSVKSMIGHTKGAAGVAGLIKAAMALHRRVLPPTIGVDTPLAVLDGADAPVYLNTETRPWLRRADVPRRAGVSAFGFGGTNFHVVLEEHQGGGAAPAYRRQAPAELLVFAGQDRHELAAALARTAKLLDTSAELSEIAHAAHRAARTQTGPERIALVATSRDDLRDAIARAQIALRGEGAADEQRVFRSDAPLARAGGIAFLFPGQGSQYPDMLCETAVQFAEVRDAFERADAVLATHALRLGQRVFPPPAFTPEQKQQQRRQLAATEIAQPALGAAALGLLALLRELGVRPAMLGGHSYGEYPALCAAGVFDADALLAISAARGRAIADAARGGDLGTMAAAMAAPAAVEAAIAGIDGVVIANCNAPEQTVISGATPAVAAAVDRLQARGIATQAFAVAAGFHSPMMRAAQQRFAEHLQGVAMRAPELPVFGNSTAAAHGSDPAALRRCLSDHLVRPVRFVEQIRAMHDAGARVFVEVGPGGVLTDLVHKILAGRTYRAVATDACSGGIAQLARALAQLFVQGAPVDLERWFAHRFAEPPTLADLEARRPPQHAPTTVMVHGSGIRPAHARAAAPAPVSAPVATTAPAAAPASVSHVAARATTPPRDAAALSATVQEFHDTMRGFLAMQRQVMRAYLERPAGNGAAHAAPVESVPRLVLRTRPLRAAPAPLAQWRGGVALLTDDGRGCAAALAEKLRAAGARAVLLRHRAGAREAGAATCSVDFGSHDALEHVLRGIRATHGPIGALLHLAPLGRTTSYAAMDLAAWRLALQLEVKSLFALARTVGSDLRSAPQGTAWLLAATGLGDTGEQRAPLTGQAGIGGLVRTIAIEWPEVHCRTVNLDADGPPSGNATRLMAELADRDAPVDVGYRGDERVGFVPVPAPIDPSRRRAPRLDQDSVVLVTGGAVGITAEIAHELAQRFSPRLVLVGRSALPSDEPADVRGVTGIDELRAAMTRRLGARGERVTPARVEEAMRQLRKEREMQGNVARLRAAGATVHYVAADVRDPQRFGELIDDVYRSFGRLDGVVHGAGLIEDKLVQDKTRESFDRVFDTKADSAFLLARKLRAEQLEFAVFFTSIAGVFGNRGQADYAAANEVVNQVAQELAQRAPGKVCALNWGPWDKTGMVSPELKRQFAERGIPLVPVDGGRALFDAELGIAHGADEVKIVAGGWAWKT